MKKEVRERMKLNNKKIGMRRLTDSSERLVGRKKKRTLRGIAIPKAFAEIAAKILGHKYEGN